MAGAYLKAGQPRPGPSSILRATAPWPGSTSRAPRRRPPPWAGHAMKRSTARRIRGAMSLGPGPFPRNCREDPPPTGAPPARQGTIQDERIQGGRRPDRSLRPGMDMPGRDRRKRAQEELLPAPVGPGRV